MTKKKYTEINAQTIDSWVEGGWEWGQPISHEEYQRALQGDWHVLLTPTKPVPRKWFPELRDAKLLGLASGGGQQMPIFCAAGACCTVFDYSPRQLESERLVAEREGYAIEIVPGDMTEPLPFAVDSFDIIFHPISNCYVEDVRHVWRECYRLLKPGGVLLAGMDNGLNFLFEDTETEPLTLRYKLPFNPLQDEELYQRMIAANEGIQFSHTLEEQVGGQLQAGLRLTDLYEDRDRSGALSLYAPQYLATRAIRPESWTYLHDLKNAAIPPQGSLISSKADDPQSPRIETRKKQPAESRNFGAASFLFRSFSGDSLETLSRYDGFSRQGMRQTRQLNPSKKPTAHPC